MTGNGTLEKIDVNAMPLFQHIAIIGLGLIGSSLCHAIRRGNLAKHISGHDKSDKVRQIAQELNLADEIHENARDAATKADLVILCVPLGANADIAREICPHLSPEAILSDVGSVKSSVIKTITPHLRSDTCFIPGHPVAGTEQSGPRAGFATLFDDRWCILTPTGDTAPDALDKLSGFWRSCGANVEIMTPEHHDLVLAITSHIPHLIAYNIVGTTADLEHVSQSEVIKFSAGGFRDFTRIAASDPTMWRDIFISNKDAVLEMLGRFMEDLTALQRFIRRDDGDALFELFTRTRAIRRKIDSTGKNSRHRETAAPHCNSSPEERDDK